MRKFFIKILSLLLVTLFPFKALAESQYFWYDSNYTSIKGFLWSGKSSFILVVTPLEKSSGNFKVRLDKIIRAWKDDRKQYWSLRETNCTNFPCYDEKGKAFYSPISGVSQLGDTFWTYDSNLTTTLPLDLKADDRVSQNNINSILLGIAAIGVTALVLNKNKSKQKVDKKNEVDLHNYSVGSCVASTSYTMIIGTSQFIGKIVGVNGESIKVRIKNSDKENTNYIKDYTYDFVESELLTIPCDIYNLRDSYKYLKKNGAK